MPILPATQWLATHISSLSLSSVLRVLTSPASLITSAILLATLVFLYRGRSKHSSTSAPTSLLPSSSSSSSSSPLPFPLPPPPFTCAQEHCDPSHAPASGHIRLLHSRLPASAIRSRALSLLSLLRTRRSVRFFSRDPLPGGVLDALVLTAGTAPSGAHQQPWTFVVVRSPERKAAIRQLVEAAERVNYERRMGDEWVAEVSPLVSELHGDEQTPSKPYLTDAPALLVVMKQTYGLAPDGARVKHYYAAESVGLAVGMLVAAIHNAGLVTLTSTPLGAGSQIAKLLKRPANEKVHLLMPVGFPAPDATVPFRSDAELRKPLKDIIAYA